MRISKLITKYVWPVNALKYKSLKGINSRKDFYKIIKLEDDNAFEENKGEAETVAGFVLEISGSFPKLNSKINFKNYVFTIEALDKKRIKQVKVTLAN